MGNGAALFASVLAPILDSTDAFRECSKSARARHFRPVLCPQAHAYSSRRAEPSLSQGPCVARCPRGCLEILRILRTPKTGRDESLRHLWQQFLPQPRGVEAGGAVDLVGLAGARECIHAE